MRWRILFPILLMSISMPAAASAEPVCGDVNESGDVTVVDALSVLRESVGQSIDLQCALCGDGLIAAGEDCEVGDLDGRTCITEGFAGGDLACATGCVFDTSDCHEARFDASGPTILDFETRLEWEKKTGDIAENLHSTCPGGDYCDTPNHVDNYYQWSAASGVADGGVFTDFLARLNAGATDDPDSPASGCYAGHCDWRLPTLTELRTITVACDAPPCVVDPVFVPSGDTFQWSGTSHSDDDYAWVVHLYSETPEFIVANRVKTNSYRVRAVRGPF